MKSSRFHFSQKDVHIHFDGSFEDLEILCGGGRIVIITDEVVHDLYRNKMHNYPVIEISSGETNKNLHTIDLIITELLRLEVDKKTFVVGVGGGVVTDLAGYVASIFKRGVRLALVPTTILGMVDAAIGGKNGVDVGLYKNMIGTIYQPEFILYDYTFLQSLPVKEWTSGFAEIIKHACIRDAILFGMLERYSLHDIQANPSLIATLVERNALIKLEIVVEDEYEKADRQLLNFGHTIGHAIENLHQLPHGCAVSIGIVAACNLSEKINGLSFNDAQRVVKLLAKYHLPVDIETDHCKVFDLLRLDKKRENDMMQFVLLNRIGSAEAKPVRMDFLQTNLKSIL